MKKSNRFKPLELTLFVISIIAILMVALSMSVVSQATKRHLPMAQIAGTLIRHIDIAHVQFEESLIKGTTLDEEREIQNHIDHALALCRFLLYGSSTELEGPQSAIKDKKAKSTLLSLEYHLRLLRVLFTAHWEARQDSRAQVEIGKAHDAVVLSIGKFGRELQKTLDLYILKDRQWLTRLNWSAIILLGGILTGMGVLVRNNRQAMEAKNSKLLKSEARFSGIIDIAEEAIISIDRDQRIIIFNRGAEKIFGYAESEVIGKKIDILLPDSFRNAHHSHVDQFDRSSDTSRWMGERREISGRRKNGEEFPVEASISKLDVDRERIFTVVLRDISKRKQTEMALRKSEETLAQAQAIAHLGSWDWNIVDNTSHCSDESYHLFGMEPQKLNVTYEVFLAMVHPDDRKAVQEARNIAVKERYPYSIDYRVIRANGSECIIHDQAEVIFDKTGRPIRMVGTIQDITQRKKMEEILTNQAEQDSLTQLYNRRYFKHRIKDEIARAKRNREVIAILLCDLDGFKAINDTLGHQAGDEILIEVAKVLLDSVRAADLVFRWGGDEFVVVLPDSDHIGPIIVAERIRKGICHLRKKGFSGLDISIGAALYPEHGTQSDELIRLADRALYIAKKGEDKIHIGIEEYRLDDQAIKVVFQPIMDVRLNQVLGYEALSRDPQGKHSILTLFKKYHAIGQLYELKCLCFRLQLKAAQIARLDKLFLNVDFNVLKRMGIPPKPPGMDVVLEISEEEALKNLDEHLEIARKWRSKDYKFAIDDFGAGFISLPFIARLIPDHIKLDRSTILQAVSSERFRSVLQELIHALRKISTDEIIAEGIETEKELQVMKDMGVYLIQGYLLGKPKELNGPLLKP